MSLTKKAVSIICLRHRRWLVLLGFTIMVAVSGCGTSETAVSGTVLVDDQPLPDGSIGFYPVDGTPGPVVGTTITEGLYRIPEGFAEGKYRVEIQGTRKHPTKMVREPFGSNMMHLEVPILPPEYNENSTLIETVKAGENTINFDLEGIQD